MSTIFMGMTLGCAVCHDHKFDPVSQKEFYQLFAFYNASADAAMDGNALAPPPTIAMSAGNATAGLIMRQVWRRIAGEASERLRVTLSGWLVDDGGFAPVNFSMPRLLYGSSWPMLDTCKQL